MIFNPDKHHRRSIRLKGYDYSQVGAYFVTICVQDRDCILGEIINGEMKLNAAGKMIHNWWNQLHKKYPIIELDEFIVMPNHLHGMIIVGADPCVCLDNHNAININRKDNRRDSRAKISGDRWDLFYNKKGEHAGSPLPNPVSLSRIIQWFKTMTTNQYIRIVKQNDWPPFNKRLWQRNYYERIIRDKNEMNRIRKYIIQNPLNWNSDIENPDNLETE